jgi:benzoyl-CoA reductase/2-hydroxyglutaryl-CoA dehydratase subunit BcrC/BadD/HgdB
MARKCPDIAAWADRLLEVGEERARSEGLRRIAYFCSYVPEEILSVAGLYAYRMRAPSITTTETADSYLGVFNCSYTRSMLQAILGRESGWMDGFVFTACCDHLRRLYDNLRYTAKPDFCHILGLPYKTHNDARDWFAEELALLRDALVDQWGQAIGEEELRKAIRECNENRRLLSSLNELRKKEHPPVTGEDMQRIVAASFSLPKSVVTAALSELIGQIGSTEIDRKFRARVLLMGGQMDDPEYVRVIEETGALVVAEGHCFGSLHYSNPVGQDLDPLMAISRRYLEKIPCPHMFDAYAERYRHMRETAKEYGVQGIVIQTMKFCDCWGIEANVFANNLRGEGFPVLRLEREYALGGIGQLRTRVQAFLESMGC